MVDVVPARARDPSAIQRPADLPGEVNQNIEICEINIMSMFMDKEEPVAAPGDVSRNLAESVDLDRDPLRMSIARHVTDAHVIGRVQGRRDHADGRLDSMSAEADPSQMRERDEQPSCGVPAR